MAKMTDLEPLAGRWVTTIEMLNPEARGQTYHAIDTYRFLTGGGALVHEVEGAMGGEAIDGVEVYTLGDDDNFVSRNFDKDGKISDYRATMNDGVWRIVGETERYATTRLSKDRIEGRWETKGDGGWTDWMTVILYRVGD